jgi:hypothetical protein
LLQNVTLAIAGLVDSCQSTLAIGDSPLSISTDNLRIIAVVSEPSQLANYTLSVAKSDIETYSGAETASVHLNMSGASGLEGLEGEAVGLSLVQYNNNPSGLTTNSTSLTVQTNYAQSQGRRLHPLHHTHHTLHTLHHHQQQHHHRHRRLSSSTDTHTDTRTYRRLQSTGTVGATLVLLNKKPIYYYEIPPITLQIKCITPTGMD